MKKLSTLMIVIIVILLTSYSTSFAAPSQSYFTNDKALDGIFSKLEREFLKYKKDEVIPLKDLGEIIPDGSKPTIKKDFKENIR